MKLGNLYSEILGRGLHGWMQGLINRLWMLATSFTLLKKELAKDCLP
jgi:hypothetical protein